MAPIRDSSTSKNLGRMPLWTTSTGRRGHKQPNSDRIATGLRFDGSVLEFQWHLYGTLQHQKTWGGCRCGLPPPDGGDTSNQTRGRRAYALVFSLSSLPIA